MSRGGLSRVAMGLMLALASGTLGRASDLPPEAPSSPGLGSRVRVTSSALSEGPLVGTVHAIEADSLAVQAERHAEAIVLAREDIQRLEWSLQPSRKRKGALIGLGVGFAAGFLGTFALCRWFDTSCPGDMRRGMYWGALHGVAVGVGGMAVGALAAPGEHWVEVPPERFRPEVGQAEPRSGVQLKMFPMAGGRRGLAFAVSF